MGAGGGETCKWRRGGSWRWKRIDGVAAAAAGHRCEYLVGRNPHPGLRRRRRPAADAADAAASPRRAEGSTQWTCLVRLGCVGGGPRSRPAVCGRAIASPSRCARPTACAVDVAGGQQRRAAGGGGGRRRRAQFPPVRRSRSRNSYAAPALGVSICEGSRACAPAATPGRRGPIPAASCAKPEASALPGPVNISRPTTLGLLCPGPSGLHLRGISCSRSPYLHVPTTPRSTGLSAASGRCAADSTAACRRAGGGEGG